MKLGERLDDGSIAGIDLGRHRNRRQGIQHVVHAGMVQHDIEIRHAFAFDGEAHLARFEAGIDCTHLRRLVEAIGGDRLGDARNDFTHVRIVDTQHGHAIEGQALAEVDEGLLQALEIMAIGVHVIGVDVGDDRNHRREIEEGRIRFVCLGHQEIAFAEPRIGAGSGQFAADDIGRVHARFTEYAGNQAGRRGLAMRAGHRNPLLQTHQLGQHQRTRHDGHFRCRGPQPARGCLPAPRSSTTTASAPSMFSAAWSR